MNDASNLTLEFLDPNKCSFRFNGNNFLIMTYDNEDKGRIKLVRAYPYSLTTEYICVLDSNDAEIGIIKSLADLDEQSKGNCISELERRYYCPTITEVKKIKERMGHFYFETVIDGKVKKFTVKDITRSIRYSSENTLLIFDMEGNRYVIPNFDAIEEKSKRLLEPYLY